MVVLVHSISKKTGPCIRVDYSQLCTLEISDLAILVQYNIVVNTPSCHFNFIALISILCYW